MKNDIGTIALAAGQLRAKKVSSVELTRRYLRRIAASKLNAFTTVDEKVALTSAKAADDLIANGEPAPLTGIPLAVKDVIITKGLRTTASSKILGNYIPPYDATVVAKLRAQKAVILGKTNLDEFAMGSSTENSAYGPTLNPLDLERVPGGSSGGSAAAVAGDLCLGSLGSDTGGSIRQPASLCGLYGFKPTYGRVSRYGLLAMASSLDQIGPLAKTAVDAKILFEAIAGHDKLDATSIAKPLPKAGDVRKLNIGIPKEYFESGGLSKSVRQSVEVGIERLKGLGCRTKSVSLPTSPHALAVYYLIMPVEAASNLARFDGIKYGASTIRRSKTLAEVYSKTRSQFFGGEVKRRIILGTYVSSAGYYDAFYKQAEKARVVITQDFERVFREVDVIVGPTAPTTAFKLGEKTDDPLAMYLSDIYTVPINLAGLPSISVPTGLVDGLPVGMQITGAKDADLTILNLAIAYDDIKKKGKL